MTDDEWRLLNAMNGGPTVDYGNATLTALCESLKRRGYVEGTYWITEAGQAALAERKEKPE